MCGFAGWVGRPVAESDAVKLEAMANAIAHRGPDDRGRWNDSVAGAAFVHNRLSIIDLSPLGRQPMTGDNGRPVLVYNGEIYNFVGLREELEGRGHRFVSRTDSEVLLRAIEEWGESALERLTGMFAFATWDSQARTLLLARDPMGMKPLYYWLPPDGGVVFASEIKAFLALPEFQAEPDVSMLRQYLELNFIADTERTSLAGVRKVPAGTSIRFTLLPGRCTPRVEVLRYFTPPPVEPVEADAESGLARRVARLRETLETVVAQHLVADVPVGILLSGGLDSSIVAALAARQGPLLTLTMAFGGSDVDERPWARRVADHLGTKHVEIVIDPIDMTRGLEDAVWWVDDLFGDWGVLSTLQLYRRAREAGVKVVLVGEGSDELFGGYPNFPRAAALDGKAFSGPRRALDLYRWYSGRRWGPELLRVLSAVKDLDARTVGDGFSTVRLFETRHQLPHCYNMKVDKASMAASVEARVPFLDVRVAREGFRTPAAHLLREGTNKALLRHVAEDTGLLPRDVTRREKFGGAIAASWMKESPEFRAYAREVILDGNGMARRLGLASAMKAYFDQRLEGYAWPDPLSILSIVAWRLLMLELWSRRYLGASGSAGGN